MLDIKKKLISFAAMSNTFEIIGKLHKKFDTEQKTASFSAREFVIELNENNYVNYVKFQLTQDRCNLIDSVEEQEEIAVNFDLRGREWQGKYFTNLNAWRVRKLDQDPNLSQEHPLEDSSFPTVEPEYDSEASLPDDDLPF